MHKEQQMIMKAWFK